MPTNIDLHKSLTDMIVNAIKVAHHYEAAIQPIGSFESGIANVWNTNDGAKIANDLEMAILGHDTSPNIIAQGLAKAHAFFEATPIKTSFMNTKDDNFEDGQKSRPETPADSPEFGKDEEKLEDRAKYESDDNKKPGGMDTD